MVLFWPLILMAASAVASHYANRRSRSERAALKRQNYNAQHQQEVGEQAQKSFSADAARYERQASGVRRQRGFAQPMDYWSALLGGDRSRMMSATAPARASIQDTYRGASRSLDRSRMRGAAKDQAAEEQNRQQTGQLASLVQGVQPMAAQQMGSLEQTIQSIMQAYSGLGLNAKAQGYGVLSNLLGQSAATNAGVLENEGQYRQQRAETTQQIGQAVAPMMGAAMDTRGASSGGGRSLSNLMGRPAPTSPGWTLPRQQPYGLESRGVQFGNGGQNPWNVPTYGSMMGTLPVRGF